MTMHPLSPDVLAPPAASRAIPEAEQHQRRAIGPPGRPRGTRPVQLVPAQRVDAALQAAGYNEEVTLYRRGGRLLAEFSASLFWFALWLFNGGCTAVSFAAAAQWLAGHFYAPLPIWLGYPLMVPVGVVVHCMVSAMEQHLWQTGGMAEGTVMERIRAMPRLRTAEAVIIGSIDSTTTSRTILVIALALGATFGTGLVAACAIIGTAMALVPEPMLRYHGVSLKSLMGR